MTPDPTVARTPRRRSRLVLYGVVGLLGLGLLWIVVTGLIARHDANAVRNGLTTLKADLARGDEAAAARLVATMQGQAHAAQARTTGPAWWFAAKVPYLGTPLRTARGGTAIVDELAHTALPAALTAGVVLDPTKLRTGPGRIDPQRLGDAVAPLGSAVSALDDVLGHAHQLPGGTWLGTVNTSRDVLVEQLTRFRRGLADLATAARLLPSQLGEHGTRRYFLAFQTEAESRGLGGLPGAYAILRARYGKLSFLRFGSDTDLLGARAHVNFGPAYDQDFTASFAPQTYFGNSDPSPHFPYSALTWMSMWQDKFHEHLDGAIATDPTALSYLLGASGSVRLRDGTLLTGSNVVPFFENQIYRKFGRHDAARKRYQVAAASAVTSSVIHRSSGSMLETAMALQRAADERRLLLYTTDHSVETQLQDEPVGGILPRTTAPLLDVVVNNAGGNKLDYYLGRTVHYQRNTCAATTATASVTLHNTAPASGLPPTVAGVGAVGRPDQVGQDHLLVSLYGTAHSHVGHATVDGHDAYLDFERERGHPVTVTEVTLAPGQTRKIVFYVKEPAATAPLIAMRQPLVRPLVQTISMPNCA